MSFIVFSTEGKILMSLTEDRWVQIPLERLLIPLFSIMRQNWTQLAHSCDPRGFAFFKRYSQRIYSPFLQSFYSVGLDKCSISLLLWSVNVSHLSSADFLNSHQIISPSPCYSQISFFFFYKGLISSLTAWLFLKPHCSSCALEYSFATLHSPPPSQMLHLWKLLFCYHAF